MKLMKLTETSSMVWSSRRPRSLAKSSCVAVLLCSSQLHQGQRGDGGSLAPRGPLPRRLSSAGDSASESGVVGGGEWLLLVFLLSVFR